MTDHHQISHFDEDVLERLLLSPENIGQGLKREIELHLESCRLCASVHRDLATMHETIVENLEQGPTDGDRQFVELVNPVKRKFLSTNSLQTVPNEALEGYAEVVEPTGTWIIKRILRYVQVYPVRSTAAVSFAGALAVLSFLLLRPTPDVNPVYAKFSNNKLHVFNQNGDTLWTRLAPGMPERGSDQKTLWECERVAMVEDIDGDGFNEVIVNGEKPGGIFASDTLYCFDGSGNLRWKEGCGPIIQFGAKDHMRYANWTILSYFTIHLSGEQRPRLYLTAQAVPYMTAKLSEINPDDGRELQAYWHAGGITLDERCDVAGDSIPEIILGAINNAFRSAVLIVLDPRDISGYGTTIDEYIPFGLSKANELFYIALTPTDLSRVATTHLYNVIINLNLVTPNTILAHTDETLNSEVRGGIIYTFGRSMKPLSVYPNDPFIKTREQYVSKGRLAGTIDSAYIDKLRAGVVFHGGIQENVLEAAQTQ